MSNEKRLIEANEIYELFYKQVEYGATDLMDAFEDALEDAQTVYAVEVIHGHWEDGYAMHNGKEVYKSIDCSVCEEVFKIESHDREYWKKRFKVCPFCGALMDGGNEDG